MGRALALAAGEARRLYRSPLAWLLLALGEGFMALVFMLLVVRYLEHEAELRQAGVTSEVLVRYFASANLGALLALPLVTMGTLAGDRASGLLRFFYSTPLSAFDIVLGKLLGVLSLAGAYVLFAAVIPATLFWGTPVDPGVWATNVLGLALFTGFHASLGVLASALTRVPLAAGIGALTVSLVLWFADWARRLDPDAGIVGGWSTLSRLRSFSAGMVSSADLAWFVLASLACLALAAAWLDCERRLP
ncbi:MAG: ABC transporter permease [Gammaproteobacteria bacterium]